MYQPGIFWLCDYKPCLSARVLGAKKDFCAELMDYSLFCT